MKPATIYDVARAAGVSHQTVTRYLHGYEGIRDSTRVRVQKALAELEYRPNNAARQLRLRASNRIAILADRIGETGPSLIIQAVADHLRGAGLVIDILVVDGNDPSTVDTAIALALDNQVAGILATAQTALVLEQLRAKPLSVPIVIDVQLSPAGTEEMLNRMAGRIAAEHLMDLGHRELGYVTGASGWFAAKDRESGFTDAVRTRGGLVAWRREGDWTAASGYAAWRSLSPAERTVTAIAAGNDAMGIGLVAAATDDGRRVPDSLSVIGIADGQYMRPALSTVELDFASEGAALAAELLRRVQNKDGTGGLDPSSHPAPLPPRLIARSTTARVVS
jgi:DNA-binding LacI/PurR family transcriptional regulator